MPTNSRAHSIFARLTLRRAHRWLAIALVEGGAAVGLVASALPWADIDESSCFGVLAGPPSPPPTGYDVVPALTYLCIVTLGLLVAFRILAPGHVSRCRVAVAELAIGVVYTVLAAHAAATLDARLPEVVAGGCINAFVGKPGVASIQIVAGVLILLGALIITVDALAALVRARSAERSRQPSGR